LQTIDAVTIQGNQDRDIYQATAARMEKNPTLAYVINDLGPGPIDWLRSLPQTQTLADEIFACHGSPRSDMVYLLEDVMHGFPVVKAEEAIQKELDGFAFPVILCGHTHMPRVVQLSSGSLVINPGSVGVPAYDDDLPTYHAMENYSSLASYAIVEKREGGWRVDLLKVPYEHALAAEQARRQGRDDWARWIATGRALEINKYG
jgi:diadenosine tetraphosphatase ApaH/serine/threonine PP2A family protein phosphatase